jgi:LTR polyprotein gag-polypeptide-like protein
MTSNNITLAQIITAILALQLHLVQNIAYAKQAWESLRAFYQPHNSLWAASMKGQIMTYHCMSDMNVTNWLNNMQCLYNLLCDLETDCMSNCKFTLAILDLML